MRLKKVFGYLILSTGLLLPACSVGVDSYEEFQASIEGGASCSELYDQRSNFDDRATLDRIDSALDDIGCDDAGSERTDR